MSNRKQTKPIHQFQEQEEQYNSLEPLEAQAQRTAHQLATAMEAAMAYNQWCITFEEQKMMAGAHEVN